MADIIQIRRDTAANWTTANTVLSAGELGIETDTDKVKYGDGITAWTSLGYLIDAAAYEPADATILKDADIGVSIQAYSAILAATTASFTIADETKLDGIEASANNYSLPLSADGTRGGIQVGYVENAQNYPVELSAEKAFVNVPWTDTTYTSADFTLDGLSDTTITANSAGEILKWNGSAWVNNTLAEAGIQPAGSYEPADATILKDADINVTVQGYDAGLAYLDGLNFTNEATFKAGVNLEIGTDVLAYDANLQAFVTAVTLPVADGTAGQVLQTDGAGTVSFSDPAGGGGLTYLFKSTAYTAAANEYIIADTTSAAFTVTLPATPATGDVVVIACANTSFGSNSLTVGRNGSTIEGSAADVSLDNSAMEHTFVYDGTTWQIQAKKIFEGLIQSTYLTGPTSGVEVSTITLQIEGYSGSVIYTAAVTGGSFVAYGSRFDWTLPSVTSDTVHTITLYADGSPVGTHDVLVTNVSTVADTSIIITDFSLNSSNTGWVI